MEQYISKSALVAEIERSIERCVKQREGMLNIQCHTLADDASTRMGKLRCFQDFLDTLEVKEVDLKQLYREYINNTYNEEFAKSILDGNIKGDLDNSDLFGIMSYGFELGLKAQKGENI